MSRALRLLDGLLEAGLLGLVLLAPLPYGSVVPWAAAGIEIAAAVLVALWVARMLVLGQISVRLTPLLWPGLAFTALVLVQLLRPGGSVSPYATWESFRLLVSYLAVLLVLQGHLVTRPRIIRFVAILVLGGAALAGLALARYAGLASFLPWGPPVDDRLSGTFANPNHEALCLSVSLFLALGMAIGLSRRRGAGGEPESERRLVGAILLGACAFAMGIAAVLTLSRGGFASIGLGVLVVVAMAVHRRGRPVVPWVLLGTVVLFLGYSLWVGLDPLLARFSSWSRDPFSSLRWGVWQATLRLAGEAPALGSGLGAYEDALSPVRPVEVPVDRVVDFAHNDYLQLLAETGVAGLVVLGWALVGITVFSLRRWVNRRDPLVRGLAAGLIGALTAVAAHSAVDFGLHLPANALLLVAVLGLLPAVVTLRMHRDGERVDLDQWERPLGSATRPALAAVTLVGLVAALSVAVPAAVAGWHVRTAARAQGRSDGSQGVLPVAALAEAYDALTVAARWEPGNPRVAAPLARVSETIGRRTWSYGVTRDGRRISLTARSRIDASLPFLATAYDAYGRSLRARPRAVETLDRFGWFVAMLDGVRRSVREAGVRDLNTSLAPLLTSEESLIPRGRSLVEASARWDPNNAWSHRSLGFFVLAYDRSESARPRAAEALRQALTLQPSLVASVVGELIARGADDSLILESTPRQVSVLLDLGRDLAARGRMRPAAAAFQEALGLAVTPAQQVEARLAYGRVLLGVGDPGGALDQARGALVTEPKSAEVFGLLGDIYAATKQWDEAETSLASAIRLAGPGSAQTHAYRVRLATILGARGPSDRAVALWRQALAERPTDAWAHLELGRLLTKANDSTGAFAEYRAAMTFGGDSWSLYRAVGHALLEGGHLHEAAAAFETALRIEPTKSGLRTELGDLYARIGWQDRAASEYRRVLREMPGDEAASRGLAQLTRQPATPGS